MKPPTPTEHEEQCALFEWAAVMQARIPELEMLFAIPNAGAGASRGQAGKMKSEGAKAGYPDIALDVARRGFHGLRIEMKRRNFSPSDVKPDQHKWLERLNRQGYAIDICGGWEEARDVILSYLNVPGGE